MSPLPKPPEARRYDQRDRVVAPKGDYGIGQCAQRHASDQLPTHPLTTETPPDDLGHGVIAHRVGDLDNAWDAEDQLDM